jgi:hypothetical protein
MALAAAPGMGPRVVACLYVLSCAACVADTAKSSAGEPSEIPAAADVPAAPATPASTDGAPEARLGEAADEVISAQGTPCRMACAIAAAAGCYAMGAACAGATVITLGGASIPCTWAIVAACVVAAPGGAALCADACPP